MWGVDLILREGLEGEGKVDGMIALIVKFAVRIGEGHLPCVQIPINGILLKLEVSGLSLKLFLALKFPVFIDPVEEIEGGLVAVAKNGAVIDVVVAQGKPQGRIGTPDRIIIDLIIAVSVDGRGNEGLKGELRGGVKGEVVEQVAER